MAVTADVVQVRLEAETARYLADLRKADSAFTQLTDKMEREALAAGRALSSIGAQAQVGAAGVTAAASTAQSSFSGVAAQFQDIGVTAAMGMNPLLIALQQGTQLSAQLQLAASRGQGVFQSLATGVAGLINPISIATIATIALGTAAVQYFSTLLTDGRMSEEVLKEQEDAIRNVADRWGEAVPALRDYVDQLDRAAEAAEEATVREILPTRVLEEARQQLDALYMSLDPTVGQLAAMADQGASFDELLFALSELDQRMADGTATAEDMQRVTDALSNVLVNGGAPAVLTFASAWGTLVSQIMAAINAANLAREQIDPENLAAAQEVRSQEWIDNQRRLNDLTADELALHNEIGRVKASYNREFGSELDDAEALALATDNLAAAERRRAEIAANRPSGGGGGGGGRSVADQEAEAVLKLIESLEYELETLSMTNEERAVSNALRQAGAAATQEQRDRITELVQATIAEQAAIESLDSASREWASTMQSATRQFINDLIEGKSAAEALGNVLSRVADQLINMGLNAIFGGFNPLGFLTGRASGGPVNNGQPYMVGERGPELFIPSSAGSIVSNNDLARGGSPSEVVVYVESSEFFDARVETISGNVSARVTGSALRTYDNNLTTRAGEQNARYS